MEELITLLKKFQGIEIIEPYSNFKNYKIWMTIEDASSMQAVLKVFLHCGWKWKCELTVTHVGTRVKPALICSLDVDAYGGDEADLQRELDYKKCLLKSAL